MSAFGALKPRPTTARHRHAQRHRRRARIYRAVNPAEIIRRAKAAPFNRALLVVH